MAVSVGLTLNIAWAKWMIFTLRNERQDNSAEAFLATKAVAVSIEPDASAATALRVTSGTADNAD